MLQSEQNSYLSNIQNEIFSDIQSNSKSCINTIENNKKLLLEYLNGDSSAIKSFVQQLNLVLLNGGLENYTVVDKVLSHDCFKNVLSAFRESDILIQACKKNDTNLVKWLLSKNIDFSLQDEHGRTALMYAAQHYVLLYAVEKMIKGNEKFIHLTDHDGNTALFYGSTNKNILEKMLKANFDIHHVNNNNENILLYNCKMDAFKALSVLLKLKLNANLVNNEGKTAAMYLVENNRYFQLKEFISKTNYDVNFKTKQGETLVSAYLKKYYKDYSQNEGNFFTEGNYLAFKNRASTFVELIKLGCDFNVTIDEEDNTPIIFFLLIQDYVSANYLLSKFSPVDLSHKNKKGINASLLTMYLNEGNFENLDYNKKRNEKSISMKSLILLLTTNPTYVSNLENSDYVVMEAQTTYKPNERTFLVQQWFLEILYPNAGASLKHRTQLTNSANGSYIFPSQ